MKKYKAILMAAGQGTRISRKIADNCKCTLDIGGISLIRHTAEMLLNFDIDVHIVVGYNKRRIFESLEGLPITFHENIFYSVTNSLASLWFARDEMDGDAIILGNADVFWENNLLSVLLNEKRDCVMLSDTSRLEQGDYLFQVQDEKIVSFGKGQDCRFPNCEYVGIAMIQGDLIAESKQRLCARIDGQFHNDWWETILYSMIPERSVWASDIAGCFWAEIDYIEDYERILKYRKAGGV